MNPLILVLTVILNEQEPSFPLSSLAVKVTLVVSPTVNGPGDVWLDDVIIAVLESSLIDGLSKETGRVCKPSSASAVLSGGQVSTGFVESTVEGHISKRCYKINHFRKITKLFTF